MPHWLRLGLTHPWTALKDTIAHGFSNLELDSDTEPALWIRPPGMTVEDTRSGVEAGHHDAHCGTVDLGIFNRIESNEIAARPDSEELSAALKKITTLQGELAQKCQTEKKMSRELDSLRDHEAKARAHASDVERQLAQSHSRIETLELERSVTQDLLEERCAKLKEAQTFFTKVDEVDDTEIRGIVININAYILQVAAGIADHFRGQYVSNSSVDTDAVNDILHQWDIIHPLLHSTLREWDHSSDDIFAQMAVQTVLIEGALRVCGAWDYNIVSPKFLLQHIYRAMGTQESQSVCGRWRALCRRHVRSFTPGEDEAAEVAAGILCEHVKTILLVCRIQQSPEELLSDIRRRFHDSFKDIVYQCLKFQRLAGEGVVSRDLNVFVAGRGQAFDPSRMEDQWMDASAPATAVPSTVLATMELGLVREERQVAEGKTTTRSAVLLKSSVVLESIIEEMQRPARK
ncbi:uncharacterized protein BXZ73DRAFT_99087 [Epithele typhae]|uniref:uncharacterized protein n=1 Tax=Epithele typhae TaxID=378194 RepID=UPI0020077E2C|nr:uncharacterized protein BXZ73DRAFT_99087 [Epithele typhae]KAH9940086.1 hypothetical protein BXZ73DRAFT_99087 [Epithele typhae]